MIAGLRPYPGMKDSGVPWVGEVPEHWVVLPLKRVTLSRCDGPFGSGLKSSHYTDTGVRVVRLQNIGHAEFRDSDAAFISPAYYTSLGDHSVRANDLLIAGLGDDRHPTGRACVAPAQIVPAMVKADCFRFRIDSSRLLPHFAALHLTATAEAASAFLSTGATRQRTNLESTSTRAIALPPVSEQAAIVRFLDHADRRIRRYIRIKQKLIKLLEEQKQTIIHRAVTRGLDPNVRLKPSGVEWLGDVPEHWEVWQIGHYSRVGNGSTPSRGNAAYWNGGYYPWINSACVNRERITGTDQFVTDTALRECHLPIVPPGSVLVAITGQGKTRGKAAVLQVEATINQHIAFITPHPQVASAGFLRLVFHGPMHTFAPSATTREEQRVQSLVPTSGISRWPCRPLTNKLRCSKQSMAGLGPATVPSPEQNPRSLSSANTAPA